MNAEEISRLTGISSTQEVSKSAMELKDHYNNLNSSIMIIEEGDGWKMTIRESYLPLVRNINPHTELSKSVMETLAVIAYKSPVLQSTVIKIRTNKAYDHINELEDLGFIVREKYGRTFMLKLTQKFFEYFDLRDKKDISKIFKGIQALDSEEQLQVSEFDSERAAEVAEQLKQDEPKQEHEMEIVDEINEMEAKESKDTSKDKSKTKIKHKSQEKQEESVDDKSRVSESETAKTESTGTENDESDKPEDNDEAEARVSESETAKTESTGTENTESDKPEDNDEAEAGVSESETAKTKSTESEEETPKNSK